MEDLEDSKTRFAAFNHLELEIDISDANACSHSGDCGDDVMELLGRDYIRNQFAKIDPDAIRKELREYGAWDDEQLSNEADNEMRILWVACGDIVDELCMEGA